MSHPAFLGAAKGLAAVFDLQWDAQDNCLFPDPESGELINISHMIPRSPEDVRRRHRGLRRIAEHTVGVMGRTPDYMNVTYAGFAGCAHEWAEHSNEAGKRARLIEISENSLRHTNDVCLTHTLIHPTIDKAKDEGARSGRMTSYCAKCATPNTASSCVARASWRRWRRSPTSSPSTRPVRCPKTAENSLSRSAFRWRRPGLKFICRDSVAGTDNVFDHPLGSRFDEQDAFLIFDDVEVPRDRLFIDANVKVYNQVMTRSWHSNVMQQTMIRAATKLEFAWGLATAMAEAINDKSPAAQQMLGELWCYAELARCGVQTAEDHCNEWGNGVWFPDGPPLMALKAMMPFWMPRANEIIKLLGVA